MLKRSATTLLLCSLLAASSAFAATPDPVADYDLGLGLVDQLGNGAALTPVGGPAITTTTVEYQGINRGALAIPVGAGLQLAVGPLLPLNNYSIEMLVGLSDTLSYAKLIDTNNLDLDTGLYAVDNRLRYYGAEIALPTAFTPDEVHHLVVTRAVDGTYTGYLDGAQQFSFDDDEFTGDTAISAARLLHFLRDDNVTGNAEESDAVLLQIRLYDRALTPAEVTGIGPAPLLRDGFEARD